MSVECRVLVVGAGPVGATCALLLAAHGVPSVVIDRRTTPQSHPAAHVLSTRSLEIWRELGFDRDIRRLSAPLHELRVISYCTTLAGPELGGVGVLDLGTDQLDSIESISPTRAAHLPQNILEDFLWERLRDNDLIDFRPGCTYVGQRAGSGALTVSVRGSDDVEDIGVQYVIGADGAGSTVRRELGITMTGPVLQHMVSVHFAADLQRFYRNRRGPVMWTHTPKGLGTIIVHRPPEHLVFQIPYSPPFQTLEDFPAEVCRRHILDAIGDQTVDVDIKSVQSWAMTAQVADRYRLGRTFLIGDAAHRFPPTGGLGLNTGIADAHNLAWKLAWVLAGRAGEDLLDSYDTERRPLGQAATDYSVRNFNGLLEVLVALGLPRRSIRTMQSAAERTGSPLSPIAHAAIRRLLPLALRLGLWPLRIASFRGPLGRRVRERAAAAIARQGPHYRSWGRDLGTIYRAGAVLADDRTPAEGNPEFYRPAVHVGGRLPHAWLDDGTTRRSTLDMLHPDRLTLLVTAATALEWSATSAAAPLAIEPITDAAVWQQLWQLDEREALLVRPDHHIAARLHEVDASALKRALDTVDLTPTDQDITA